MRMQVLPLPSTVDFLILAALAGYLILLIV
jgi:hypothetical protein